MDYKHILNCVMKPARYLGSEINAVKKDAQGLRFRIALAFPDLYEVGMPHLGLAILYHIVNSRKDMAAERVFAPDLDYAAELEKSGLPLASLESKTPLGRFDVVGFTLQYELSYTNILFMLRLGGIPLRSDQRREEDPLIIGGGPCAYNPEPLARFFDLFVIGDGEEIMVEVAETVATAKEQGGGREETLKRLSELEGIYVPAFFQPRYGEDGALLEIIPLFPEKKVVRKRWVADLNQVDYPTAPLVPYLSPVHNRLSLELDRGCTQGCRFCQAGTIYRPVRERSCLKIEELLDRSLDATGYEEFSLLSLSSGDYSRINFLVPYLLEKYRRRKIALSLPSLRPGTIPRALMETIQSVRKTGFTISTEAGTQRLRDLLNKDITEEDVLRTVTDLSDLGWEHLKLYFMIGLPTETQEDVREIQKFCFRVLKAANQKGKQIQSVNLGVSYFVPKSHTPFQWVPQEGLRELEEKMDLLFSLFKRKREFSLKRERPHASFLEAVFAKGDRTLGAVIERAFELGCRFDGWGERFRFDLWQRAFEECGVDPSRYAHRPIPLEEKLPWSHIQTGVSEEFLKKEYQNALEGVLTKDCRRGKCHLCGQESHCRKILAPSEEGEPLVLSPAPKEERPALPVKFRMRFSKTGEMKYISHLDLNRVMHRAFLRASLPLAYSEGFHPHPRISYASALSLGMESLAEYADVQFQKNVEVGDVIQRLNAVLPQGIRIMVAWRLPPIAAALTDSLKSVDYEARVRIREGEKLPFEGRGELEEAVKEILEAPEILLERERKGKLQTINISPFIEKLAIVDFSTRGFCVAMALRVLETRQIQPQDVLGKMVSPPVWEDLEIEVVKKESHFRN